MMEIAWSLDTLAKRTINADFFAENRSCEERSSAWNPPKSERETRTQGDQCTEGNQNENEYDSIFDNLNKQRQHGCPTVAT